MGTPSRLTNGLSTAAVNTLFGDYPLPDPFHTGSSANRDVFTYYSDFTDSGTALNFTVTGASSTFAVETGLNGFAVLTPGAATTASSMYRNASAFQFQSGYRTWFAQRIIPGLFATTGTYAFGLQFGSATTDGIWFTKPASSTSINLVSSVASTATTLVTGVTTHTTGSLAAGATTSGSVNITYTANTNVVAGMAIYGTGIPLNATIATVVSSTAATLSVPATATGSALTLTYATPIDVGFYYNGTDLMVFSNDNLVARVANPSIGATGTNLTSVLLTPFVSCTPTATDLLHIDYTFAAQETSR